MDYLERVSRKDEDENFCVILQSTLFTHFTFKLNMQKKSGIQ